MTRMPEQPATPDLPVRRGDKLLGSDFAVRLRDGVGNSTVNQTLRAFESGLGQDSLPKKGIEALFKLFAPIEPADKFLNAKLAPWSSVETVAPETLADQLGATIDMYGYLEGKDKTNLIALTKHLLQTLGKEDVTRKVHGEVYGLSPQVQQRVSDVSQKFASFTKEEMSRIKDIQKTTKRKIPLPPRIAKRLAPVILLLSTACGMMFDGGTGNIPTEVPVQTPIVEPGPTMMPVSSEMAGRALASWIGVTSEDGFSLPDANGDGAVDAFTVLPGQISMVDSLTRAETGRSVLVSTPSGSDEYDLFLVWENSQGTQAYHMEGYRAKPDQTGVEVDLVDANGDMVTTMSVDTSGQSDVWATLSVEEELGDTPVKKLIALQVMGTPQEQQEFFTHLATLKVRAAPDIALTPMPPESGSTEVIISTETITVGSESFQATIARDPVSELSIATRPDQKGLVYIQEGGQWAAVDLAHPEATWPQEVKDKIPTILSAEAASDRQMADNAPATEWRTHSDYLTQEVLLILKTSGVDISQFSLEGKTPDEALGIKDSLFDAWVTWNEQNGIKLTAAPESLIAAVVSYKPNYTVQIHYGENNMTFGWAPTSNWTEADLKSTIEYPANHKDVLIRGETFTIYKGNASLGVDGRHRVLLNRIGFNSDMPIDVVGLENNRNTLVVLMPKDSTTISSDLCLSAIVIGQAQEVISCGAGEVIGHTYDFRTYPGYIIAYDDNYPQKLMDNPGAQIRHLTDFENFYWLEGIPVAKGYYSTAFK